MFIRVSGSASCYSGVAGGWTDECTVNYCLASWYSGSASSNHNGWEGTLCVACDARKRGVSHSLMSPLSLRADSHSETLTGCPRLEREWWRRGEERGKGGNVILKLSEKYPIYLGKQEKKNFLILTAALSPLRQYKKVINKSYNSTWNHNSL